MSEHKGHSSNYPAPGSTTEQEEFDKIREMRAAKAKNEKDATGLQDALDKIKQGKVTMTPYTPTKHVFQDAPNSFSIYEKWNGYEYRLSAPSIQELCALHKTWKQQFKDTPSPDESK